MFLDRHDGVDATREEIAAAHEKDLAVQDAYAVQYHAYWYDAQRQALFCLAEGPSKEAVDAVHVEAHGLGAPTIIELDPSIPLNEFLGAIPHPAPGTTTVSSPMRAIVFTDICGSVALTHTLGDEGHMELVREHDRIVRAALAQQGGNEIKHTGDGIMAAFASIASSVAFAIAVQREFEVRNASAVTRLEVSVGISAGEPVTGDNDDLYGAAVQLAARLCDAATNGDILVSIAVRELCVGKSFRFDDHGELQLKGIPDLTHAYRVAWADE
jgi:class 3 adenylate cyclase